MRQGRRLLPIVLSPKSRHSCPKSSRDVLWIKGGQHFLRYLGVDSCRPHNCISQFGKNLGRDELTVKGIITGLSTCKDAYMPIGIGGDIQTNLGKSGSAET